MQFDIQLTLQIMILAGIVFNVYNHFRNPDIKAKERLNLIEQRCVFQHKSLDGNIFEIKENHLKHLEEDVGQMKLDLIKIKTILEERLPK